MSQTVELAVASNTAPAVRRPGVLGRAARAVPPLLTFAALGGLLYWGHRTDWTPPKFSALAGEPEAADDEMCAEHTSVPKAECVECNPGLMPRPTAYGWCKVHGVHECPLDHPDVAQTATPPTVTQADFERAARALALTDRPENNPKCGLHARRIQFATVDAVAKAGVDVTPVWTAPVVEAVSGPGEVTYDPNRTARLSARGPGTVFRAFKQVGDRVTAGELVALIDAAEVGRVKAEFLQAVVQGRLRGRVVEGQRRSGGAVSERERAEAEAAVSEARIRFATAHQALTNLGLPIPADALDRVPDDALADRLRFLGLPSAIAGALDPHTTSGNLLPVVAPFDAVVTARDVVAGEVVDAARVLFVIADPARMWLTLDMRQEDAARVKLGQPVRFAADGGRDDRTGTVTWVSTEVDHKARTLKVRAVLDNADGRLKANSFGVGRVVLREEPKAIVVPASAVFTEGNCRIVFVRDRNFLKDGSPKVFHVRSVRTGAEDGTTTEIIAGVLPGELVVSAGGDLLRTELLRGDLGAGCGCHEH